MAPKIGGNREIPAYFLLSVLLKLLSTCGGEAELSASVMICFIALQLKTKKPVCLLSCRQAYWIIDMIHSISKVYTPLPDDAVFCLRLDIHSISMVYTPKKMEKQTINKLDIHSISMVYTPPYWAYTMNRRLDIHSISMVYTP